MATNPFAEFAQQEANPFAQFAAPPAAEQIPFGRRVIQFIRPTVEALGTAAGGVVGGGGGTLVAPGPGTVAGAVGGAGLGYGIAKTGLDILEQSLGYQRPPATAGEALARGAQDVLTGSTMETAGRLIGPAVTAVVGKAMDLRQIPKQKAAKITQEALGRDIPNVINALRTARPDANVAELTAGIQNPTWQALVNRALERDPQFVRKMNMLSDAESQNALAQLAGGATAADVRATIESAKTALNAMTGPQREAALSRANLGKAVADYEAQAGKLSAEAAAEVQRVRDLIKAGESAEAWARLDLIKRGLPVGATKYTFFGELSDKAFNEWSSKAANASLDLGQGARFAKGAADALRSVGIKPLEGASLSRSIQAVGNNPEFAGNDIILGALKNVSDDIMKWTSGGGVIDARALDAIRKNSVNAAIQQLRPGMDATAQRNLAAQVLTKIRPALTDAIESAGGAGYRDYLANYAKGMQAINQKKLTGEALKLWKTNQDEFVRLVQNESPETVEKFLGPGNYNIATELAENTMEVLRAQAAKKIVQSSVKAQVSEGQAALRELLKQNVSKLRLPSHLQAWVTNVNRGLQILEDAIGQKTMDTLTQALKTPQGAADLISTLPGQERLRIMAMLDNPQTLLGKGAKIGIEAAKATPKGAVAAGVSNALAPESEPQNALLFP